MNTETTCPAKLSQQSGFIIAPEQVHWAAEPCMTLIIRALEGQRINLTLFDFSLTRQILRSSEQLDFSEVNNYRQLVGRHRCTKVFKMKLPPW